MTPGIIPKNKSSAMPLLRTSNHAPYLNPTAGHICKLQSTLLCNFFEPDVNPFLLLHQTKIFTSVPCFKQNQLTKPRTYTNARYETGYSFVSSVCTADGKTNDSEVTCRTHIPELMLLFISLCMKF